MEPPDLGLSHRGAEKGVFTGAFHHTPPARVAGNVDHGRKGPMHAAGRGFDGGGTGGAVGKVGVPGCGLRQWHGKYRAETVDHIIGKQQRDMQARLGDGLLLQLPGLLSTVGTEHRTDGVDGRRRQLPVIDDRTGRCDLDTQLAELVDFFFQRHLPQQVFHRVLLNGLHADAYAERQVEQG